MVTPAYTPPSLMLARLFWMMAGPAILFLISIQIVFHGEAWFTPTDLVFGATIGGMIFAKWVESLGTDPRRADGEPVHPGDVRRFGIGLVAAGFAVWVLTHLVGNYLT